jgi:hypothetical protein
MTDAKRSEGISNMLNTIKAQAIDAILSILKERKHINIKLHKPIMHQYIDDNINEVISVVRVEFESVILDTGSCCAAKALKDLPIEQLADLLMSIENGGYENDEEAVSFFS